ncbi:MAG TPA: NADP-dependent malic enzyme [Candidatus Saccharimonadales bacterium]|jgi:malate dehydrogenase (oxaloacetate-decarboxylating)|nr:NADP-dependent malic enzyme [Candidatus Saccharimonadales bacterium]
MDIYEKALELHKKYGGKISTALRDIPDSREKLSAYYSPGVAAVSRLAAEHPEQLRDYSWTKNLVAVISDGSAVLGLGDIGPYGAMPVMEGKAMLFKHFANIDAVPIVLDVHTADEIVATVKAIAPSFGGINLEDISAPKCFEVEDRLKAELKMPVFHDDQHGTAVVVLAGLINSMKVVNKKLSDCKIVIVGAGAAGVAIAKLLKQYADPSITAVDSKGVISSDRTDLNATKQLLASFTRGTVSGSLREALTGADIVIGVSGPNTLTPDDIKVMATGPIVFGLANPTPEIMPADAKKAGAAIVATGRSDYPNQVNNATAFPGIFRGALDHTVSHITDAHKIAAAEVIAALVETPTAEEIIPSVMDERLVPAIAAVIV